MRKRRKQNQPLKSERGSLNVGIKDMFMTMTPELFRTAMRVLDAARDPDKKDFNLLLEKFELHKQNKPRSYKPDEVEQMRLIRGNDALNRILSGMLASYWHGQDMYDGGFFWRMMPKRKTTESEEQYRKRRHRMEDNLMQLEIDVLDDCSFFIHY